MWLVRDIALQVDDETERNRRLKALDDLLNPPDSTPASTPTTDRTPAWYGSDEDAWAAFEAFAGG